MISVGSNLSDNQSFFSLTKKIVDESKTT